MAARAQDRDQQMVLRGTLQVNSLTGDLELTGKIIVAAAQQTLFLVNAGEQATTAHSRRNAVSLFAHCNAHCVARS
jgi:hypothetical protein